MTKIPTWRMKELEKEYKTKTKAAKSIKEKLETMELPAWRKKELVKEMNMKLRVAQNLKEIMEAGVYGA